MGIDISDQDVFQAMKDIEGYLDISPVDFRELYIHAVRHAGERLLKSTLAEEIMTSEVTCVGWMAPFEEIIRAMAERSVSGLPVVDDTKRVVGVVSEKDIFRQLAAGKEVSFWSVLANCLHGNQCLLRSVIGKTAADIMTAPAVTVKKSDTARQILHLFAEKKINRLPVVTEDGCLAGIVTRSDLLSAHLPTGEL